MDAVAHLVGRESAPDLGDHLVVRRNLREGERAGGAAEALEMFVQLEDAPVVKP